MVATLHDTIRLDVDLDGTLPTNEYRLLFEGAEDLHLGAVVSERGITGKLHVHRLLSGGNPVVFQDHHYTLKLTRAEMVLLLGDLGKTVYFMPNYRDDADVGTYRFKVLFESASGMKGWTSMHEAFMATIYLRDNSDGSVG